MWVSIVRAGVPRDRGGAPDSMPVSPRDRCRPLIDGDPMASQVDEESLSLNMRLRIIVIGVGVFGAA